MSTDLSQFGDLSLPQKLTLVEALWDQIAESGETLPVPDWQKAELDIRAQSYQANPIGSIPWDEVKRQIRDANGQ